MSITSCGGGGSDNNPQPEPPQAPNPGEVEAQAYVAEILSIMQNNALTRKELNWDGIRSEVLALADGAESISQTYPAITRALELIGTNHSFLNGPDGTLITYPSDIFCPPPQPLERPELPLGIAYIRVDAISTRDNSEARAEATAIQNRIASEDNQDITGWIVDLRNNAGGNMWPMVAGLGPLFEGATNTLGHFIDPDEVITLWGYDSGSAFLSSDSGRSDVVTVSAPYTLINPLPKIAVLSSETIASSGEATLISFKKQVNVRIFGSDSCGLSTANQVFTLSDGSQLFLTVSVMADREQQRYGQAVAVDQASVPEETVSDALQWLTAQGID
ncbi:S41 family peptidase [Ningiella sp. W23]|uniref:S41 family peptidase n=1 Tax=Ningiella sp. W23 TaxID=3023715 RepID=UPI0037582828